MLFTQLLGSILATFIFLLGLFILLSVLTLMVRIIHRPTGVNYLVALLKEMGDLLLLKFTSK